MGKQYLIDSNVVIDYLAGKLQNDGLLFMNQIINNIPAISVVTKIEILGFEMTNESTQLLESFVEDSLVVGLTDEIVDKTIEIRRKSKIKMPDAIIAATAFACNSILITRNIRDFQNIEGLEFVNPYDV